MAAKTAEMLKNAVISGAKSKHTATVSLPCPASAPLPLHAMFLDHFPPWFGGHWVSLIVLLLAGFISHGLTFMQGWLVFYAE